MTQLPIEDVAAAIELLPCPFCGGSNVKTHGPYGWERYWCISHNCKVFYNGGSEAFKGYPNEAYAIQAWNTRPNQIACPSGGEGDYMSEHSRATMDYLKRGGHLNENFLKHAAPPDPAVGATARELLDSLRPERFDTMLDVEIEALHERVSAWITAALARAGGSEVRRDALEEAAKVAEAHIEHDGIAVVELSTCFADARSKAARKIAAAIRALSDQEGDGL